MSTNGKTYPFDRIGLAVYEGRREFGFTQARFAALSETSQSSVSRAEHGEPVSEALLVRMGTALKTLDAYRPPSFEDEIELPSEDEIIPFSEDYIEAALLRNGRPASMYQPRLPFEFSS